MTRSLSAIQLDANFGAQLINTNTDGDAATVNQKSVQSETIASGNSNSQANTVWKDLNRSLSDTATENIDMYDLGTLDIGGGSGNDALGQSIAHTKIVAVKILNNTTSTGTLLVGGIGATTAWSTPFNADDDAVLSLPPGAWIVLASPVSGFAVADTTDHLLQMEASGGDLTYSMQILGRQ